MGPDAAAAAGQAAGNSNDIEDSILSEVAGKFGQTYPTKKPDVPADGDADPDNPDETTTEDDPEDPEETTTEDDPENTAETATDDDPEGEADKAKPDPKDEKPKAGDEYAAETAQLLKKRLKDLPEPTRKLVEGVIGGRIATIVAKERTERERLGERVEELATENTRLSAEKGPRIVSADIHPTLLMESERDITSRTQRLDELLDWADDHKDGVEPTGEPGEADYKPGYTKEQVRQQMREWRKEKEELIPQAREKLRARAAGDAVLKEIYPAVFDAKSPEHKHAAAILAEMPQLRRFANMNQLVVQQLLGMQALEKLFQAHQAAKGGAGGKGKAKEDQQPPRKQAPRAPGGGSAAKGSDVVRERGRPVASDAVKKVMANPGDKKAFANAIESLVDL